MPDRPTLRQAIGRLFATLDVPADCRTSYRFHLAYALFDAAGAGILSNAGIMALRGLGADDWHLGLRLSLSSAGMFATLPLGHWMARRRKMPFVLVPGVAFAVCSMLAALTSDPLLFLILLGGGAIFEVALRPAVAAVIRTVYPVTHRGAVTGAIRKWSSLVFLASILLSAAALSGSPDRAVTIIHAQLLCAGALSLASFLSFRRIATPSLADASIESTQVPTGAVQNTCRILGSDARFRRYLFSSFLFGFFGLLYSPYVAAFLVHDLSLDYLPASVFLHVVPSAASFLVTAPLGRWIDRTSPWTAWKWIRIGWGLDPILLVMAGVTGTIVPGTMMALPLAGRLSRGASMGGSWILWWQIGINHFAKPGADTSRYMGIFTFLNGVMRLCAPMLGAWLMLRSSRTSVLLIGRAIASQYE